MAQRPSHARQAEAQFGQELNRVLSPSRAIQSAEFLRGRAAQLQEIREAFYAPGRQIFIYGHKGVGKTSLAQTAAFERQSSDSKPIMISCTHQSICFDLIQQIGSQSVPTDPRVVKQTLDRGIKLGAPWAGLDMRKQLEQGTVPTPSSLTDCARILQFVCTIHSKQPVVIIDEFDRISNKAEQAIFGDLIKMVGDHAIDISMIICGVGESIEDLMQGHGSTHRYLHAVELGRLPMGPRLEIIEEAADALGIEVDDTTRYRIAKISDGFPHYVHLLCEKLFWEVFRAEAAMRSRPEHFEAALGAAAKAMQPELKRPYELATKKYANDYEPVLWAVADGDELSRASRDIYLSYERILRDLGQIQNGDDPERKKRFNAMMNRLKKSSHGSILMGTRAGWYEYKEKIVRGYARLRAAQYAIQLEREHPLQIRRFNIATE